ncbi:MAG: O-antigen ligase family protein [Terricaulis sp.]|nr:O-antigen ligase family protein [Terricaulis sp.]
MDRSRTGASAPRAAVNPAMEYLPDLLVMLIILFLPMRLFGVGPLTVLIWMGCGALLIVLRYVTFGRTLIKWWPLLLMPLILCASFIWSDAPGISLRYGFQVLLTCLLGVFLAHVLSPTRFAIAMFAGMLVFCVASILDGRQGVAETGLVLIGLTGSKNSMAFAANMLISAAAAMLFLPKLPAWSRALGAVGLLIGAYIVAITASATAVVLSFAIVAIFTVMCFMQRFTPAARAITIVGVLVLLSPLAFATNEITAMIHEFMREVLNKDPENLTGRTYLWNRADDLIAQRPLLGYGFQAIWLSDSSETLGLLRWAGVADGRTFNFHHTYRQLAVDVGIIGSGVFVVTLLICIGAAIRQFILMPSVATSFVFSFFLITLVKSFTEVIVVAFSAQTLLLFVCCVYAFWTPPSSRAPAAPARTQAPRY